MPLKLTFVIKRSKRYIVQLIQGLITNEKEEGQHSSCISVNFRFSKKTKRYDFLAISWCTDQPRYVLVFRNLRDIGQLNDSVTAR